jgi:hypothetical protein
MRDLYKMKEVYIYQTWYSDDLFELDYTHRDRYIYINLALIVLGLTLELKKL